MTHGGQEPAQPDPPAVPAPAQPVPTQPVPTQPRLAASNPKSGRQLAMIMGAMMVFFVALVALSMWAADHG